MPRQRKTTPLDEAVAFLRGHDATGTPVTNPYYLFARDFELCCDADSHLRPDSYYGRMSNVAYDPLFKSMENIKGLWDNEREADAETLLVSLLDRSYEEDVCVNERLIRDFVRCAVRWRPHSLEAYR